MVFIINCFAVMESNNKLITGEEALATFISGVTFNGSAVPVESGVAAISAGVLPTVTSSDNGKVLMVSNGAWQPVSPVNIYSGSGTPSQAIGNDGDIYLQT